jgi:hypothetical protein
LIRLLKKEIISGDFNPFSGTIYSQKGLVHSHNVYAEDTGAGISVDEIIIMDWLADNVVGSIPDIDDLTDEAKALVQLQGIPKMKDTDNDNDGDTATESSKS